MTTYNNSLTYGAAIAYTGVIVVGSCLYNNANAYDAPVDYNASVCEIAPPASTQKTGTGWENYVAPQRKTVKQFKKEFEPLTYLEVKEKQKESEIKIKLTKAKIIEAESFSLESEIIKLKLIIAIERNKLEALKQLEEKQLAEAKVIKRKQQIDADLVFIAAYMLEDDE